jgi:hypothetical protein
MMKSPQGWVQGYNAQIMVEESSGVIVAQEVSSQGVDTSRLGPMLEILEQNLTRLGVPETGRCPRLFTAEAGYCSEGNLRLLADRGLTPMWPLGGKDTTGLESGAGSRPALRGVPP